MHCMSSASCAENFSSSLECESSYPVCPPCFSSVVQLKINATKSMIGHLIGAAGAVEAIAAVQVREGGRLGVYN